MHVCVHAFVCICVHMHMCAQAYGGPEADVRGLPRLLSALFNEPVTDGQLANLLEVGITGGPPCVHLHS